MRIFFTKYDEAMHPVNLGLNWFRHSNGHPWKALSVEIIIFGKSCEIDFVWHNADEYAKKREEWNA